MMIAKLDRAQSIEKNNNKKQTQNQSMGVTINNEATTTEAPL